MIKILHLGARRGPAKEAQALYEDLQPIVRTEINKEFSIPMGPAKRDPGSGRPTKSERRAIERLMGWLKGR